MPDEVTTSWITKEEELRTECCAPSIDLRERVSLHGNENDGEREVSVAVDRAEFDGDSNALDRVSLSNPPVTVWRAEKLRTLLLGRVGRVCTPEHEYIHPRVDGPRGGEGRQGDKTGKGEREESGKGEEKRGQGKKTRKMDVRSGKGEAKKVEQEEWERRGERTGREEVAGEMARKTGREDKERQVRPDDLAYFLCEAVAEVDAAVHRDVRPEAAVEDAIGGKGSSETGSRRRDAEKSVSKKDLRSCERSVVKTIILMQSAE
ncbi:hypothetical protein EI94DRAFT_1706932 [Lactarius quietus]|nr:hypothetical protein EI94DRAFT_1706932 [Lactarius quietus]